jgi:hypothetical protein
MLNIDPVGITPYAIGIEGKPTQWSWKCKCGMWQSEYFYRYQCQNDYDEHRAACEAHLTKRAADDGYCMCENSEIDEYKLDGKWVCMQCQRPRR